MSNRLKKELSPYLLQHSENPVDWYPWSEEAFEKAMKEDKPIFLSIGYSTCHWCHVMEKESFEDEQVAELMNNTFVSIKVDREERPDIDNIYMEVCQMLTGSGGWPLTVIMTPEKIPFFAGTYFPKLSIPGRIGMIDLINRVQELWTNHRNLITHTTNEIIENLKRETNSNSNFNSHQIIIEAINYLHSSYDRHFGGFGHSPKFPIPHQLLFLMNHHYRDKNEYSLEVVKNTLIKMRLGGIFDQIGYGFHRYSTDNRWLVPHFEKMLYDQALLVHSYLDLYQITKDEFIKMTVIQTLEYVQSKLSSDKGGFYSGEDADSEGVEGKFYLWTADELRSILNFVDYDFVCKVYNISDKGNFSAEYGYNNSNANILNLSRQFTELSKELNLSLDEFLNKLISVNKSLYEHREKRIHPFKDDKILTDWNGLMISAFAKAGRILNNYNYIEVSKKAVEFILNNLTYQIDKYDNNGRCLFHRFRNNQAGIRGNLDDYAFLVFGLIELYKASLEFKYLILANDLTEIMIDLFEDKTQGGFYFTSEEQNDLILRKKIIYDGAVPSGNSVALHNLINLYHLTGKQDFINKANDMINLFGGEISKAPSAYTFFLQGLDLFINGTTDIILVGNTENPKIEEFHNIINQSYLPNLTILFINESNENEIKKLSKFTIHIPVLAEKPAVYFCNNFQCSLPIYSIEELKYAFEKL